MKRQPQQPVPTMVSEMVDLAAKLLIEAAHPDKIILFGSHARGDFDRDSDLDFLVILPSVESKIDEMARLRLVLGDIPKPIDIVVYSRAELDARRHLRGTMLFHALREGVVLYDAA